MTAQTAARPTRDEHVTDVDVHDPGDGSLPIYRWRQAGYDNLATRRQLRAKGLRPGGHEPVARIECRGGKRWAWLYRIGLAVPKIPMTLAKEAALDRAMAARQQCPGLCGRRYTICLPLKTLGTCVECHDGTPADPTTYITPAARQALAA